MRIVAAVTNDMSYDQRMQRICKSLVAGGHSVTLVGRELPGSPALPQWSFSARRLRCWFKKGALFYAEYNLRLFWHLTFASFDTGIAVDLDTLMAMRLACKLRGKRCVFDAHELFTEVPELDGRTTVKSIWNRIGFAFVPSCDLRYTVGPAIAAELSRKYKCHFAVVRNLPEHRELSIKPLDARERIIFYQGALNEGRGLEQAITAMQGIDGYTLELAGEGDLSVTLRALVAELGLSGKVRFLGRIEPGALPALTARATLGLNLLERRSESYYFSLANKFFDYLQAGLPSVNMAFPEYKRLVEAHGVGICIETLDPRILQDTLQGLVSSEDRLQQMIGNCKATRDHFTWQDESQKLIGLFDQLV